jgi:hypothetical protein
MTTLPPNWPVENVALTAQERRLIETLRLLVRIDPDALNEAEEFVWSLVKRHLQWSYSDPASLELATAFAALDPQLRRESDKITADFAGTVADGLENC